MFDKKSICIVGHWMNTDTIFDRKKIFKLLILFFQDNDVINSFTFTSDVVCGMTLFGEVGCTSNARLHAN